MSASEKTEQPATEKGEIVDVDKAIQDYEDLISRLPNPSPERAENQRLLGYAYARRFEKHHLLSDLNSTILQLSEALEGPYLPFNEIRIQVLFDVGRRIFQRFGVTGDLLDLSRALHIFIILVSRKVLDRCEVHDRLGSASAAKYQLLKDVDDINTSVEQERRAVTLAKDTGHSNTIVFLSNLGHSLRQRFEALSNLDDIDQAILCHREALSLPAPSPHIVTMVRHRLGHALFDRFLYDCSKDNAVNWSYWTEAVQNLISVVELENTSHDTKHLDMFRTSLARVLLYPLPNSIGAPPNAQPHTSNADLGIRLLQQVANQENARPSLRVEAAMRWARFEHHRGRFSEALEGYSTTIELLPLIGWNGLAGRSREESTNGLIWLSSDATSCAIQLNRLEEAIEVSDHLRSLFWNGLSRFRLDTEELRDKAPDLANKLSSLAEKLENPSLERQLSGNLVSGTELLYIIFNIDLKESEVQAKVYRQLTDEWECCVEEVRKVEGFENFLKRRPFSVLRSAASAGPVVILIVGSFHSDALIVRVDGPVKRIPLTITEEEAAKMVVKLGAESRKNNNRQDWVLRDILATLWEKVCKPVLDELKPTPEQPVWWCPTGNLSFLPIHAAGKYNMRNNPVSGNSVPQNVISSYTVSLGRLLDSRSKFVRSNSEVSRLLLVGKEEKPSYDKHFGSLPFVPKEMEAIKAVFASQDESTSPLRLVNCLLNSESTVDAVLTELNEFVHFSCHGKQEWSNPILSRLLLHDQPGLTLLALLKHWISRPSQPNLEFAFLSACETATGSNLLPDQATHLAAGMQFIGFPRVVATLWTIQDEFTVLVSHHFYEELIRLKMSSQGNNGQWDAGVALHNALRKAIKVKPRNLWGWAPYIHMGV